MLPRAMEALGTLSFSARSLNGSFFVSNTVVNGINPTPSRTGGEGPASGEEVQITITFTKPIVLPAGQYFFRPEVLLTGGDFLYLSVPGTVTRRAGFASLDPQLTPGAGLGANRHRHHRRYSAGHCAQVQYGVLLDR